jgi:hypothetical protein
MTLSLFPVELADGRSNLDSVQRIEKGGGPPLALVCGIGADTGGRGYLAQQGLADQLLEGGFSLHGSDFCLSENVFGEIDRGFHEGIKTAIWLAVKREPIQRQTDARPRNYFLIGR